MNTSPTAILGDGWHFQLAQHRLLAPLWRGAHSRQEGLLQGRTSAQGLPSLSALPFHCNCSDLRGKSNAKVILSLGNPLFEYILLFDCFLIHHQSTMSALLSLSSTSSKKMIWLLPILRLPPRQTHVRRCYCHRCQYLPLAGLERLHGH